MKNKLYLILISLFFITGCKFQSPESQLQDRIISNSNAEPIIITGVIAKKDITLKREGTHLLQTPLKELLPLQSKTKNLNKYLGKTVEIIGKRSVLNPNIIDVSDIKLIKSDEIEMLKYNNKDYRIGFNYPSNISISVSDKIKLADKNKDFIIISKTDKITEGEEIQINNRVSGMRVDQPNGDIIISVQVNQTMFLNILYIGNNDTDKSLFYELLNTLYIIDDDIKEELILCGGPDNILCKEGYYCEVHDKQKDSKGICQPLNTKKKTDRTRIIKDYLETNFISNDKNKELVHLEFLEPDIVSIVYTEDKEKRKLTYRYEIDKNNDPVLKQIAYFEPGVSTDWVLKEGENIQAGKAKTIVKDNDSIEIIEGYRELINKRLNFSTQYPANWYFAGLQSDRDELIYKFGFSDKPLDESKPFVFLEIVAGDLDSITKDNDRIYIKKDDKNYFVVYGEKQYFNEITNIANSIKFD